MHLTNARIMTFKRIEKWRKTVVWRESSFSKHIHCSLLVVQYCHTAYCYSPLCFVCCILNNTLVFAQSTRLHIHWSVQVIEACFLFFLYELLWLFYIVHNSHYNKEKKIVIWARAHWFVDPCILNTFVDLIIFEYLFVCSS